MNGMRALFPMLLSFLLGAAGPAAAGSLVVHDAQGIRFVSGGVGQDERGELRSLQDQFNLLLMFAAQGGAFLSAVAVRIEDRGGRTVLEAVSDGPYLYAALPPGTYVITASLDGRSNRRNVTVAAGRATRADFFWK